MVTLPPLENASTASGVLRIRTNSVTSTPACNPNPAPPVAIDLLAGPSWQLGSDDQIHVIVRSEGTEAEVGWLADQVQYVLWSGGGTGVRRMDANEAHALWQRQVEFSDRGAGETADRSPLVVKIAVPPSNVSRIIDELIAFDPECTIQSHAASGIIVARFAHFTHADLTRALVGKLRPAAVQAGGSLVILSATLDGLTPHLIWGGRTDAIVLMERIKSKFDPHNILNPGRFVF